MAKKDKEKKISWFKRATRVVGMNPKTFEEWWRIKVNNIQLISILIVLVAVLFTFNYLMFAYTPVAYILPEGSKNRSRAKLEETAHKLDELERQLNSQDKYILNLQNIILGNVSFDSIYIEDSSDNFDVDALFDMDTTISEVEKKLNESVKAHIDNLKTHEVESMSQLFLFEPVNGTISQRFRLPDHPGVDVVTAKDSKIKACLNGIVINSSYSNDDGHIIIISHDNNLISVYKHAKEVFVKTGDKVSTGGTIGIVGNTGERSTGPHLHFELWSDMGPINPLDYFSFRN